jgi:DNA/RNA-binding domain of Phe-tRNA-synthetase-like protein
MEITISENLKARHKGVQLGTLVIRNAQNKDFDERLDKEKRLIEQSIRESYKGGIQNIGRLKKYSDYYFEFNKNFPVKDQIKAILDGQPFPNISCLVDAMFMAELKHSCLIAGHDLDAIAGDLVLDLGADGESYVNIKDEEQPIVKDDIVLRDTAGIIASVLDGPDNRTKIIPISKNIIYMVYFLFIVPRSELITILADLAKYLRLCEGPHAEIERMKFY